MSHPRRGTNQASSRRAPQRLDWLTLAARMAGSTDAPTVAVNDNTDVSASERYGTPSERLFRTQSQLASGSQRSYSGT
jgi:hypothetical protein